jgi:hypothetical protein
MPTQSDIDRSQGLQDKGIGKEFQNVYRKSEEQRSYMDDRFQWVEDQFQALELMAMNSRATSSWHDIAPIGVLDPLAEPQSMYHMPPNFPNKVIRFWRLQRPQNQHTLVSLLHFYNIRGLERWKTEIFEDSDNGDSESSSEGTYYLLRVLCCPLRVPAAYFDLLNFAASSKKVPELVSLEARGKA